MTEQNKGSKHHTPSQILKNVIALSITGVVLCCPAQSCQLLNREENEANLISFARYSLDIVF